MKKTAQYDYTIVKPGYWQRDLFGNVITGQAAEPITRPEPPALAQQTTMFDSGLVGTVAEMAAKNQIPSAYRTILALAQLDANRQHIALTALAHYRQFTPASFKDYCGHLAAEQADEASEKPAAALLLGVVAESAILPDAADAAPVAALDGDLHATVPAHLTRTRTAPEGRCKVHKVPFVRRPLARQSTEVRWCGDWWDCPAPGCGSSVLIPSEGLTAQLASMRRDSQPQS